jgi:hypothetical protein
MMTDQEVFLGIVRIGETLTQHLTAILEPFRLTLSQYSVLNSLRLTRLVDRLEVRGFVRRLRERPDRRVVRAQLTADGLLLLEQLDAPIGQLHARHIAPIGKRQLGALSALLEVAYAAPPSPARLASR